MPTRTAIRNQIVGEIAVKKSLQQRGDDGRAVHTINHQMLAPTAAALAAVIEVAKVLGFESTPIHRNDRADGTPQFSCDLNSKGTTIFAALARQSILMGALAEGHGCTYNGWGTMVVPVRPPVSDPASD